MKNQQNFEDFWTASSLNRHNIRDFARAFENYDSDDKQMTLEFPLKTEPLRLRQTALDKIAKERKSSREFSGKPLSLKELSRTLSGFYAWNGLEHRGFPSAGATYAVEIFIIAFKIEKYTGNILYYDAAEHGIVPVGKAPCWEEAHKSLNVGVKGEPAALIIFTVFDERATAKYGERGGRFALLEAGAAMQQLSLQVAGSKKLKGVILGGAYDETWMTILGLGETNAKIACCYLLGK